jgi:hypothetical protein
MASNYRALTSANEEWRKITATMAPSAEGDPPTVEQQRFLREKLNELFRVHRESTVSVQALVGELESARPGFVPQHQLAAVLGMILLLIPILSSSTCPTDSQHRVFSGGSIVFTPNTLTNRTPAQTICRPLKSSRWRATPSFESNLGPLWPMWSSLSLSTHTHTHTHTQSIILTPPSGPHKSQFVY